MIRPASPGPAIQGCLGVSPLGCQRGPVPRQGGFRNPKRKLGSERNTSSSQGRAWPDTLTVLKETGRAGSGSLPTADPPQRFSGSLSGPAQAGFLPSGAPLRSAEGGASLGSAWPSRGPDGCFGDPKVERPDGPLLFRAVGLPGQERGFGGGRSGAAADRAAQKGPERSRAIPKSWGSAGSEAVGSPGDGWRAASPLSVRPKRRRSRCVGAQGPATALLGSRLESERRAAGAVPGPPPERSPGRRGGS